MVETTAPRVLAVAAAVLLALALPRAHAAGLSAEMKDHLAKSEYVYVSSQRKDGTFSPPAEIWFFVDDGAVWVGTKKSSWRVRRILAGRPAAKVHAFMPSGPSFEATAAIVDDKGVWQRMFAAYEKKYASGWKTHGKLFAEGAADGSYVLVRYTPTSEPDRATPRGDSAQSLR